MLKSLLGRLVLIIILKFLCNYAQAQSVAFPSEKDSKWDTVYFAARTSFAVTVLLNQNTEGKIKFQANDSIPFKWIVHPSSDIELKDGKLNVHCKGLDSHPTRVAAEARGKEMTLTIRSKDLGTYTMLWWNDTDTSNTMRYEILTNNGQYVILDRSYSGKKKP